MSEPISNATVLAAITKLEGLMEGHGRLMQFHHESINKRLDDKIGEVISHIDRHERQINGIGEVARKAQADATLALDRLDEVKKSSLKLGAGAGTMVAASFEFIKTILKG